MSNPRNPQNPRPYVFHPAVTNHEIWPGPAGYPWASTGVGLWTREGLLRRVGKTGLIATWTTGGMTEPWEGNFGMIRRSEDNGATWADLGAFRHPVRGLFVTELFSPRDGEVHAFLNTYANGEWMTNLQSYRAVSFDGGQSWSGPHSIPGGIHNVWPNRGIMHSSGRWIIPVSWAEQIGEEWAPPALAQPEPAGQVGTRPLKQAILPPGAKPMDQYRAGNDWADRNHRYAAGVMLSDDAGRSFRKCGYITGGVHGWLIEPRVVERSDGSIVMLIRSQRDGRLWRSESFDRGESWSPVVRSEIPNPAAKVNILRAADGRIFLIHNPVDHGGQIMGGRNPLSLWVSHDDMKTWPIQVELVRHPDAGVSLNYPDGFIDEEAGVLRFLWEDVRRVYLMTVPLREIGAGCR